MFDKFTFSHLCDEYPFLLTLLKGSAGVGYLILLLGFLGYLSTHLFVAKAVSDFREEKQTTMGLLIGQMLVFLGLMLAFVSTLKLAGISLLVGSALLFLAIIPVCMEPKAVGVLFSIFIHGLLGLALIRC